MQILCGASGGLEININAFIGVNFVAATILLYRSPQTANLPSWYGADDTTGQQTDCTEYTCMMRPHPTVAETRHQTLFYRFKPCIQFYVTKKAVFEAFPRQLLVCLVGKFGSSSRLLCKGGVLWSPCRLSHGIQTN